jgi:transporter family protein
MRSLLDHWQLWAILSALFAAATAILGKIGVEGVDSNFATLIRTVVIVIFAAAIVVAMRSGQPLNTISSRTWIFLILSALATGASWLCYYRALKLGPASQVAPVDKLSVVLVAIFSVLLLGEHLALKHWLGVGFVTAGAILLAVK